MCTLVLLYRPGHAWPLIVAGNRDERLDRPWDPPGRHWPGQPGVIGGRDRLAGGSWMASRDDGLVASVMNRSDTLGPAAGRRSRGELVLLALGQAGARQAAHVLAGHDPLLYRPYNLVVADRDGAWWVAHRSDAPGSTPACVPLEPGLHMLTAMDLDDAGCPRIRAHLPAFRRAPPPAPATGDFGAWEALLSADGGDDPAAAMSRRAHAGFGTVCSTILSVPANGRPRWRQSTGAPHATPYQAIDA